MNRYSHLELDKDINRPGGFYTPQKEVRLPYHGRDVLYIISQQVILDASRCGVTNDLSALVPGYIIRWQIATDEDGLPVSEVEPIIDKETKENISKIIQETEHISDIEFW